MTAIQSSTILTADSSLIKSTETRSWHGHSFADDLFARHGTEMKPAETITLKGRLECLNDNKGVLSALSKTRGVISSHFYQEDLTEWIEVSWLIRTYEYKGFWSDHSEDTADHINGFIDNLKQEHDLHVFIESLKPVHDCDGERNGFWGL
jgi:hypothetical protein